MITQKIAKPYAKALLAIAIENNKVADYQDQAAKVASIFAARGDLGNFLSDPKISKQKKIIALQKLLASFKLESALSNSFLLLVEKSRAAVIEEFIQQFIALCQQERGQKTAIVTSAQPLSAEDKKMLWTKLKETKKSDYELKNPVDPDILGGFIWRADNMEYDLSWRGYLQNLLRTIAKDSSLVN